MNNSTLTEHYIDVPPNQMWAEGANANDMQSRKRALTSRFLVLGMVCILLISILMSLGGYIRLQVNEMTSLNERIHQQLTVAAKGISSTSASDNRSSSEALAMVIKSRVAGVEGIALFDASGQKIFKAGASSGVPARFNMSDLSIAQPSKILGPSIFDIKILSSILDSDFQPVVMASLVPLLGKRSVVVISVDHVDGFARQRKVALRLMLFLLLSTSLLFGLLYATFLHGMRTIEEQEQTLNQQISSLSNLLAINKSMQKSMRTASARAVELNEQFLRRTGADLHDGPAQMIGFSVMRLNQALDKDESGLIGPEFHAIKQALEESLEEIRGISSGLVLPELETMTLEQCMRKVVLLHTSAQNTDVAEFYQDIDREIPLPIKICAYRFVQEGLSNASRHGRAEKCRLSVHVSDHTLQISLKDNGVGFRKSRLSNNGKHLGLMGMKDRIESLGGKLAINSELGVGTSLKLSVSLHEDIY